MKATLAANKFKTHNNKSKELVASKFHSTLRNVRIVINTGIDKNTGKPIKGKAASFKAVFINNQSQWRTIATGASFQPGSFKSHFGSKLTAIEVGAEDASTCKCGAKKFRAKSGNVVCANAPTSRPALKRRETRSPRVRRRLSLRTSAQGSRTQTTMQILRSVSLFGSLQATSLLTFRLLRVW